MLYVMLSESRFIMQIANSDNSIAGVQTSQITTSLNNLEEIQGS